MVTLRFRFRKGETKKMRMMERRKQFSLLIYFRKIFPSKMSLLKVSHLFKNFDTCQQGKCQMTAKSLTRQFSKKTAIKGIMKRRDPSQSGYFAFFTLFFD